MTPLNKTVLTLILSCAAVPIATFAQETTAPLEAATGDVAVTVQMGSLNHASILQAGHGNVAAVVQSGVGLTRQVVQTGTYLGFGSTQVNGKAYGGSFAQVGGNGFTSTVMIIEAN